MSGWQLGLTLFGCLLVGFVSGWITVFLYGRRLIRRKLRDLPAELLRHQQRQSTS